MEPKITLKIVQENDPNISFTVVRQSMEDALYMALSELGYTAIQIPNEEDLDNGELEDVE